MKHTPNKEIAHSFLKMAGSGLVQEAYDKFVAPEFIHHNQYFKGDRQSLMQAMIEAHKNQPNVTFQIKHTYEDGPCVVTHSYVAKKNMEIAVVHIFKFHNGKIVELWDLGQQLIPNSPNKNGLF